jgi:hypothetical protein
VRVIAKNAIAKIENSFFILRKSYRVIAYIVYIIYAKAKEIKNPTIKIQLLLASLPIFGNSIERIMSEIIIRIDRASATIS